MAPSPVASARARETAERWAAAFGSASEELQERGRALTAHLRGFAERGARDPGDGASPPTRWTLYRPGSPPETVRAAA